MTVKTFSAKEILPNGKHTATVIFFHGSGFNMPLILAGVGGSVIGVWKRIQTDRENKQKFVDIMNEIEGHNDYRMISFSDVIIQKQNQFEEIRAHLIANYNFNEHEANIVATLQMIIDSMLTNMIMQRQQHQGIQTEIAADILSQLKNFIGVTFQKYGKHMFNLMDDAVDVTVGFVKGLSLVLAVVSFTINFFQLVNETEDRAEKVRIVTKMKDKLQSGADSILFLINVMHDMRERINSILRTDMEEELQQFRKMTEQRFAAYDQLFRMFTPRLENNVTDGNGVRNLDSIDFTESNTEE